MPFKIALLDIEPPLPNLTSQHLMPRHGILAVGTSTSELGHLVEVFVEVLNGIPKVRALTKYDVVGASITGPAQRKIAGIFRALRARNEKVILVGGGPHATVSPNEVLDYCDFAVRGDGEETLPALLKAIDDKSSLEQIPGLSYRDGARVIHTRRTRLSQRHSVIDNLSLLTRYRRRSIFWQWFRHGGFYCGYATASRGCPYPCTFCYENMIGGTGHRPAELDTFIDDLRNKISVLGVHRFWLSDSNFGTNPRHCHALLDRLIAADLGCTFTALCRTDIAQHPDVLAKMAKAGFTSICIGMESVSENKLLEIKKQQSLIDIKNVILEVHRFGIAVFGLFMVGFDDDTIQTPTEIVDFCLTNKIDGLSIYMLNEYKGLPGRTLARHRICELNDDFMNGHFATTFPLRVAPSVMEEAVFRELRRFYSLHRLASEIVTSSVRGLAFRLALWAQFRKMARISRKHCSQLRMIERNYYDMNGYLILSRLISDPVIKTPLEVDILADWEDPSDDVRAIRQ